MGFAEPPRVLGLQVESRSLLTLPEVLVKGVRMLLEMRLFSNFTQVKLR